MIITAGCFVKIELSVHILKEVRVFNFREKSIDFWFCWFYDEII